MFARQVSMHFQPTKIEEGRRIFNEQIAPELRKQKGNVEVYLLEPKNQTKDEFISVSIWKNEMDAEKYEQSGKFDEFSKLLKPFTTGQLTVKQYDLLKQFS